MNILIINHYATPPNHGTSTRHYTLAKELNKLGHQVVVIAADQHHFISKHSQLSATLPNGIKQAHDTDVEFLFLPTAPYKDNSIGRLWNMLSFAQQLLKLKKSGVIKQPDIIIGSSVHPFTVWSAEKLAQHYQVPFYFEVRDIWPQSLIEMQVLSRWHPLTLILSYLERRLYRRAKKIITLLPYLHEYLADFNVPKEKVLYIPNGVDLELFPVEQFGDRDDQVLTIMYLGSHGAANGLDAIVDAAAELEKNPPAKKIKWRFIGEGPLKAILKQKVEELGLSTVTFEDRVPKSQVPFLIADASILIVNLMDVAVYRYGISLNKLFDYLASKRPIIFGCNARNNPIADADAGITVPAQDASAIAQAVRTMAQIPAAERHAMGERGRQYAENHHSYALLAKRLSDEIETDLSSNCMYPR